jgi:NADH-quinone oxidoreductase subunit L
MHHEQDMRKMGGLRKYMPITYWTSLIGTLALVGTPFLSGFYSKDTIIEAAAHNAHANHGWIAQYGYWAVLLGVFVTSFYSFRLLYLTFHGPERFRDAAAHDDADHGGAHHDAHAAAHGGAGHEEADHDADGHDDHAHHGPVEPRESPWVVIVPLILLAIPSIAIGYLALPLLHEGFFGGAIHVDPHLSDLRNVTTATDAMSVLAREFHGSLAMAGHAFKTLPFYLMLGGLALATAMYLVWPRLATRARHVLRWPVRVLEEKYGFDELWIKGFAGGGVHLGRLASKFGDAGLIDGVVVGATSWIVDRSASLARRLQSGYLYHYAFAMILGLIVLLAMLARTGP